MKTQPQICRQFDQVSADLQAHGFTLQSDGVFVVLKNGAQVFETPTVDGLFGFLAGLEAA